jgi:hypothetical protein
MENKQLAQGIASLGRYGDTTLMHMRPEEVNQLTAISRANGGDITINPDTGMPEAFLGNFINALLPTAAGLAAGAAFGPSAPFLAPALAGGATAYLQGKRDPLSIGMGALSGYGGAQLGSTLSGFGATKAATPELASTAGMAGGTGGTPVADAALTGQTIGATGGTTAGANAFGQEQFISPFTQQGVAPFTQQGAANTFGNVQNVTSSLQPTLPATTGATYAGPTGMAQTLPTPPTPAYRGPVSSAPRPNFGAAPSSPKDQLSAMADYTGDTSMMQSKRLGSFEQGIDLGRGLAETGKGFEAAMQDPMGYLKFAGKGDALMGGVKTALPFAGAGLEAYQKGIYEDLPTYEASTAGRYDPTRTLNLGMDTGLRLLAKGGEVKRYQAGGNIMGNPVTTPSPYLQQIGMFPASAVGGPPPEYGIVDVGGNFVKTSDKPGQGLMSKTSYYETYKFKEPGYTAEANKEQGDGGDFDSKAGIQPQGGAGVDPALALQAAQGYAESQQSNLDEQGLGTLKTGGSVRRFQMGGTTAEKNMYGQQDSNQPAGLGSLTTAEQNLPGRMGMAGRTDLQNATTAEQNIAREPMQEAGTVVTQQMGNDLASRAGETFSRLPVIPGDANNNMAKILGVAMQSNPQGFTVVPNETIPPTGAPTTALNLNTGKQEPMAMGGRVRYAEGGISALTPDDGKMLNGNGDGVSDDIPAMIEGEQEAALSDGEFIVPARIVSELGNGSSDAGAKKLYAMIDRIQAARQKTMGDNKQYAKDTNAERFLPV